MSTVEEEAPGIYTLRLELSALVRERILFTGVTIERSTVLTWRGSSAIRRGRGREEDGDCRGCYVINVLNI